MVESKYYRNWHLANDSIEYEMTELEFALMRRQEAYARWVEAAYPAVGQSDLKHSEHIILHLIRMLDRPKSGTMIARQLNRDDLPNIQYSLRKLEAAKLVKKVKEKNSKTSLYTITELGKKQTTEYSKLRSDILIPNLKSIVDFEQRAHDATQLLSILTGIYEESARSSASYNPLDSEE